MTDSEHAHHPVLNAIVGRQSAVTFRDERPPRELVERLLEAAVMAPNHHLTQPWRFIVLTGDALRQFGDVLARNLEEDLADPTTPEARAQIEDARRKPLRAPVMMAVASARSAEHPRAIEVEEVAATAAAIQNVIIAAPDLGLGAFWRTGKPAFDPRVKAHLGLQPDDEIVGFIYVGYPSQLRPPKARASAADKTRWLGWERDA